MTRVHNMELNTKTDNALSVLKSHRKTWTVLKQPSSGAGHSNQATHYQGSNGASNCLLSRRKDFKEVKTKGVRKFDLDDIEPSSDAI